MKLYYSPGACSQVPHILIHETGLKAELVRVDLRAKRTENGDDYKQIAPKGSVPLLQLDDGSTLTEGPVIAQYLCDKAGRTDLMPAAGTMARYRVMEWQNFITAEIHKSYSPLFKPNTAPATKAWFRDVLKEKYALVSKQLERTEYLTGSTFTAADAYLFTVSNWAKGVGVDIQGFAPVRTFLGRVSQRPAVQAALRAEGFLK